MYVGSATDCGGVRRVSVHHLFLAPGTQDAVNKCSLSKRVNPIPGADTATAVGSKIQLLASCSFQFSGETDKQTIAIRCESAGKSLSRGGVLPRWVGMTQS